MNWGEPESLRLLRTKWPNASMLAEEIYALMFGQRTSTVTFEGPIEIINNTNKPAVTIINNGNGSTALQVGSTGHPGANGTNGINGAPGTNGAGAGPANNIVINNGNVFSTTTPSNAPAGGSGSGSVTQTPTGGLAQITGGSGASYTATLYLADATTVAISVTQKSIAATETIPVGTWVYVVRIDTAYYMQHPVWLTG